MTRTLHITVMRGIVVLLVGVMLAAARGGADEPSLHLDHVPIAVRDLPAALAEYRALGFTIKPGRPHQNGIENASVKFADGSYVELITSHGRSDRISREYEELLKDQEGAAYVFLRDQADGSFTNRALKAGAVGMRRDCLRSPSSPWPGRRRACN